MPFVKLDCGILNSTIWFEKTARDIFITALLMAEPREFTEPVPTIAIRSLDPDQYVVPPGWYGFVPAAGVGIMHRAKVDDDESGYAALEMLASPEPSSRSKEFDGRRMVRVDGGYLILNYIKYRERDYTAAERSRRYRERLARGESRRSATASRRNITQAEAEAEAEAEEKTTTATPSRVVGGLVTGPLAYDKAQKSFTYFGARLRVPHVLHDELRTKLGGQTPDAALRAWYAELDEAAEISGEPIPDVFVWLRPKFQAWAESARLAAEREKFRPQNATGAARAKK